MPLSGYYETDGEFTCLKTKSITAVLSNTSNTVSYSVAVVRQRYKC